MVQLQGYRVHYEGGAFRGRDGRVVANVVVIRDIVEDFRSLYEAMNQGGDAILAIEKLQVQEAGVALDLLMVVDRANGDIIDLVGRFELFAIGRNDVTIDEDACSIDGIARKSRTPNDAIRDALIADSFVQEKLAQARVLYFRDDAGKFHEITSPTEEPPESTGAPAP